MAPGLMGGRLRRPPSGGWRIGMLKELLKLLSGLSAWMWKPSTGGSAPLSEAPPREAKLGAWQGAGA